MLAKNLAYTAELFAESGVRTLIEPLNTIDTPNICLSRVSEALTLLRHVGYPNAGLQFDIYHMAQMEIDYMVQLKKAIACIGHMQISDVPGRGEPGSGKLDFNAIFDLIDSLDYKGYIGTEYQPTGASSESLGWYRDYQNGQRR